MSGRMLWFQRHQVWTSLEHANTVRAWSSLQAFWNIKPFVRSVCLGMWEQCHSTPANTDTAGLCPLGRVQRYDVLLNNHINRGQMWNLILFDASWKYQIYRAQTGQVSYAKITEKLQHFLTLRFPKAEPKQTETLSSKQTKTTGFLLTSQGQVPL